MRWALATAVMLLASPVSVKTVAAKTACQTDVWTLCYTDAGGAFGYDHAILGSTPEWREITLTGGNTAPKSLRFETGFIEDTAPHMVEIDGRAAALVVHTDPNLGARLVVISLPDLSIIAATAHIGARHRWLAPLGVGDFDGDNRDEIAYVDRPHLARDLVFVQIRGGQLREIARQSGLTNHRIGDDGISGGVRNCGAGDQVILATDDWRNLIAARMDAPPQVLGDFTPRALRRALACQ